MIKPGMQNPPYEVELSDGRSKNHWGIKLDGGAKAIQISSSTTESMALTIHAVGKKIGDFDEQRDWTGGRGNEYFSDDPTGYFDAKHAWTLTPLKVMPTPQWFYADGYRVVDMEQPGDVTWKALTGDTRYISRTFTAGHTYSADKCQIWIRRRGNPGTLTFALCSDSGGSPDAELKTATVTTTTIDDVLSVIHTFDWTGTESLTATTVYHVKVYGAATDSATNHWEVGVNAAGTDSKYSSDGSTWNAAAYSMYYRCMAADTARQWFGWMVGTTMYIVDKPDSGTSAMYTWNETTDLFGTEVLTGTSGLTIVSSQPVVSNGVTYFPQGEATNIRRWTGAAWADDSTNKATFLCVYNDSADGPQVVKANTSSTVSTIARADAVASGSTHTFRTAINVGNYNYSINGITVFGNQVWVFKSDSIWSISNDRPVFVDAGLDKTPSARNGLALAVKADFLFYSWLNTIMRKYSGSSDDIGQAWKGKGVPSSRTGNVSCMVPVLNWLFAAIDAGASGTSSVQVFDGQAWHEIFRAPAAGKRIKTIWWQPVEGANNRLWIDCGGDLIYIPFPLDVATPTKDTNMTYNHEFVLTSSTIEMSSAAKLPKYIRDITIMSEGLTDKTNNRPGNEIWVDYQIDEKVGLDGYENWTEAEGIFHSPEEIVDINEGDIRKFRYRLRGYTADADVPVVVTNVTPSGFARSPYRRVWNIRLLTGEIFRDGTRVKSDDLIDWLYEAASFPGRIKMTSIFPRCHDHYVIVAPPTISPTQPQTAGVDSKDTVTISLLET